MQSIDLPMALTFAVIAITIVLYAIERFAIEAVSLGALVALMAIFTLFPESSSTAHLSPTDLLQGFANPALITILCLLIIGQGLFQTDALERPALIVVRWARTRTHFAVALILVGVGAMSAFLNNTPVVVMFLPILSAMAATLGTPASRVLMPLSFITILGGMTTLIGSSTNILVADIARQTTDVNLQFFSFAPIGAILAAVGAVYVLLIMPRLLKTRQSMADEFKKSSGKQFIAQIEITHGHPLVGVAAVAGMFPALREMTVRLVQRGEEPILPPFENLVLRPGDTVIVAATRRALTKALSQRQPLMTPDTSADDDRWETPPQHLPPLATLAEAVVAPASRLIGRTVSQAGFHAETGCVVMGIQRRSRMPRMAMNDIRLEAGDVLLLGGTEEEINYLRGNRDVLLLDWSTAEVPRRRYAPRALLIFAAVVIASATGLLPIATAALMGTFAMVASRCLNVRQALRAVDSRILMLVGSSIALSMALEATGGGAYIAHSLVDLLAGQPPAIILSALYLLVMVLTNMLSNNASAVLFTPIATNLAHGLGLSPEAFLVCIIFAANSSFATPIGYQTNLIVMGPGHYRFQDFLIAGTPLAVLLWLTFSFVAPWYYGL